MNYIFVEKPDLVDIFCLIKTVEEKVNIKGAPYLDFILADRSGEINAKLWDYDPSRHGAFEAGKIVKVRGRINQYKGTDQIRIEKIRTTVDSDKITLDDVVPSAEYEGGEMLAEIKKVIAAFSDENIRLLVSELVDEYGERLLYFPAAFRLHHAVRGGLLYHTLSMLRLAQSVCAIYPFINKDLLFAGIILHDICKTEEYTSDPSGLVNGYTIEGTLVGHLVKGAIAVERTGVRLGTPRETITLLEHMLISHHGVPEFGAAVRPLFLEADILSQLDLLDSRIYEIAHAVSETAVGEFTSRQWALEDRKLYNHGLSGSFITNIIPQPEDTK